MQVPELLRCCSKLVGFACRHPQSAGDAVAERPEQGLRQTRLPRSCRLQLAHLAGGCECRSAKQQLHACACTQEKGVYELVRRQGCLPASAHTDTQVELRRCTLTATASVCSCRRSPGCSTSGLLALHAGTLAFARKHVRASDDHSPCSWC